ncbi:MAG UNVERIFIED_CONTAM: hypothetical protein MIK80_25040 [Klebsiella quasipneumoniae]|jgi:hypothetical protein
MESGRYSPDTDSDSATTVSDVVTLGNNIQNRLYISDQASTSQPQAFYTSDLFVDKYLTNVVVSRIINLRASNQAHRELELEIINIKGDIGWINSAAVPLSQLTDLVGEFYSTIDLEAIENIYHAVNFASNLPPSVLMGAQYLRFTAHNLKNRRMSIPKSFATTSPKLIFGFFLISLGRRHAQAARVGLHHVGHVWTVVRQPSLRYQHPRRDLRYRRSPPLQGCHCSSPFISSFPSGTSPYTH